MFVEFFVISWHSRLSVVVVVVVVNAAVGCGCGWLRNRFVLQICS